MVKNYIVFNENGKIKKHTLGDLYAGSHLVDAIYLFADFGINDSKATLMCRRSDGLLIDEVDCLPGNAEHPLTGELTDCFSFLLGRDVLGVAGPLQITARYYNDYVIEGITEQRIRATGMVVANVYESVPTFGGQSTIILNLNRKINDLSESFIAHEHDNRYYTNDNADAFYANNLDVSGDDIILQSKAGKVLSRVRVPTVTVVQTAQPGTLLYTGTGDFILAIGRKYILVPIGTSEINFDIYRRQGLGTDITYTKLTMMPILTFSNNVLLELKSLDYTPRDPFDGDYNLTGEYYLNGIYDTFDTGWYEFGGPIGESHYPVLGFNSVGYYQAYVLE